MTLPILAITEGDIAGVGPEIVAMALADGEVRALCRPAIFGPLRPLQREAKRFAPDVTLERVENAASLAGWDFSKSIPVVDDQTVKPPGRKAIMGTVNAEAGRASHQALLMAIEACKANHAQGLVTAPIHKGAWAAAGVKHPGHTEVLAEQTGVDDEVMMLAGPTLRVALVTIHVPLSAVAGLVTRERVLRVIKTVAEAMPLLGIDAPRIAVAGLNPHASDGGLFGDEEAREIIPAMNDARALGLEMTGPLPADTIFRQAMAGEFDAVVAMYHDQGLGPIKTVAFDETVNVTLGLPIIRTSVDHGTAFDIAGTGKASPASLIAAIRMAAQMAARRGVSG